MSACVRLCVGVRSNPVSMDSTTSSYSERSTVIVSCVGVQVYDRLVLVCVDHETHSHSSVYLTYTPTHPLTHSPPLTHSLADSRTHPLPAECDAKHRVKDATPTAGHARTPLHLDQSMSAMSIRTTQVVVQRGRAGTDVVGRYAGESHAPDLLLYNILYYLT